MTAPLLAIIPARGGSHSIPRKALQQVGGVPLLLRTLRVVNEAKVATRIVVSTDDPEVASLARLWGAEALHRPAGLSGPDVPLIDVAAHLAAHLEWEGPVAIFQPTCPLLTAHTIRRALAQWETSGADWAITASPAPHIYWQRDAPIVPRVNRQKLTGRKELLLRESGAIQVFTPRGLTGEGKRVTLPIPEAEALDVDTWDDLLIARRAVARRNILFRVVVSDALGSGHLYRAIRLAEALHPHHVGISIENDDAPTWALQMLDDRGLWWEGCESTFLDAADLVVLDTLDTTVKQAAHWKEKGLLLSTFEDQGAGLNWADLVVNELLPPNPEREYRILAGPRYAVLRDEFACAPPHAPERDRILVTFGGTDPARLNARVSQALAGYDVRVMLGPGADRTGVKGTVVEDGSMAEEMHLAQLVVTGRGRTQYEAAAMGAPAILIAANERESRHTVCPGHLALGLHAAVSDSLITWTVHSLCSDLGLLAEMATTARKAVDGRGVDRIIRRFEALLEEAQ